MRALKALVVIMGIMLVVGTVALIIAIVKRKPADGHPPAIVEDYKIPATQILALPSDAHIDTMIGVDGRLVLHSVSATGEAVVIVDPTTGAVVRTLEIRR